MKRTIVTLLAVGLIALAVWTSSVQFGSVPERHVESSAVGEGSGQATITPWEVPERSELVDPGPESGNTSEATASGPESSESSSPRSTTLYGTVLLESPSGRHRPKKVSFSLLAPNGKEIARCVADDGEWTTDVPNDLELFYVDRVRMTAGRAYCSNGWISVENTSSPPGVELLMQTGLESVLHVIDSESLQEIPGVEIRMSSGWTLSTVIGGPAEGCRVIAESLSSPIRIAELIERLGVDSGAHDLWVRSPTHAWANAVLDLRRGGERHLMLRRGGSVAVSLRGPIGRSVRSNGRLVLRDCESGAVLQWRQLSAALVKEDFEFHGIPEGPCCVSILIGRDQNGAVAEDLASRTVDVRGGQTTRVELDLPLRAEEPTCSVRGSLVVPRGRDVPSLITFWRLGHPVPISGRLTELLPSSDGLYSWELREVPFGRYVFSPAESGEEFLLQIEPGVEPRIELRPLADFSVSFVTEDSGQPWMTSGFTWAASELALSRGNSVLVRSEERRGDSRFRFRAPQTELFLQTQSSETGRQIHRVIPSESRDILCRVRRAQGLLISFRQGRTEIPCTEAAVEAGLTIVPGGQVADVVEDLGQNVIRVYTTQPGAYRALWSDRTGEHSAIATEAIVDAGEFARVTVELPVF